MSDFPTATNPITVTAATSLPNELLPAHEPTLRWAGKAIPPPATDRAPALCEIYGHGEELGKLIQGDNLAALRWLSASGYTNAIDLVYIDPPFGGGSLYSRKVQLRGADAAISFNVPAYQDIWSSNDYLQFIYERLLVIKDLLSESGCLYLHVDTSQAHYLKVICDEVFGRENFQREIVWRIGWVSGYKTQAKNWIRNHDTILFYTKSPDSFFFDKQFAPYAAGYRRRDGSKPHGKGHPIEDTWNCSEQDRLDSIQIKSFSREKTGYPTQKNQALLERIIKSSCPEGGLVLDCFAGSGTTPYVARKMSRRWIACDVNPEAIHTTRSRMLADGCGQLSGGFGVYTFDNVDQSSLVADVSFKRKGNEVDIRIHDLQSPMLLAAMQNKKKKPSDWTSITDSVFIDLNYDGSLFRMDYADIPRKQTEVVKGSYRPRSSGRIAIMIVDLLGNKTVVSEPA